MRAKTLEINWHDGQAIYSVDFSSDGTRMASAGADTSVRLWSMKRRPETHNDNTHKKSFEKKIESFPVHIDFLSELKRHSAPVNVVRFSPSGEYLASAGDDSCVILWKKSLTKESTFGREYAEFEKETWSVVQMFHGHNKEIYDLAWSPCSQFFITASIDNTARIWSISTRSAIHVLTDHTHYVQGVSWDPMGQYVATQSSDRSVAIYKYKKEGPDGLKMSGCSKRHHRMNKKKPSANTTNTTSTTTTIIAETNTNNNDHMEGVVAESSSSNNSNSHNNTMASGTTTNNNNSTMSNNNVTTTTQEVVTPTTVPSFRMYHDETLVTFFRRLAFSPEGAFLITPAGLCKNSLDSSNTNKMEQDEGEDLANCAYLYPRNTLLKHPMAYLSNHNKPSIAIRWCGDTYELRPSAKPSVFELPYRMIYAVASQDAVYVYDTQQASPLCIISGMHFAPITDIAWSHDGSILAFSSADGYCSAVVFDENELGKINLQKPNMIPLSSTSATAHVTSSSSMVVEEHDIEMMDITSPPEKQPISMTPATLSASSSSSQPFMQQTTLLNNNPTKINNINNLIRSTAEKRTLEVNTTAPKKRRIAPTLISSVIPSSFSTATTTSNGTSSNSTTQPSSSSTTASASSTTSSSHQNP